MSQFYFNKISTLLIYNTVHIKCTLQNGDIANGTGFFFDLYELEDKIVSVIVTNKHVIEGAIMADFEIPVIDAEGNEDIEFFSVVDFESKCILHDDIDVDLAVFLISDLMDMEQMLEKGLKFAYVAMSEKDLPSEEDLKNMGAIEDVVMIGYPDGIMDTVNVKPITRKGITATHVNIDYEGKKEFLIDIACFDGSSGSPVFLFYQGAFIGNGGNAEIGSKAILLGILYAGFDKTVEGQFVSTPIRKMKMPTIQMPLNLGVVIKSQRILDFRRIMQLPTS